MSPQQLLQDDVRMLHQYTNAPQSAIDELVALAHGFGF